MFSASETFEREIDATRWIACKERELARPGGVEEAVRRRRAHTLGDVIDTYVATHGQPIGRSKMQNLRAIQRMEIELQPVETLVAADFSQLARGLLMGVQPAPFDPDTAPLTHYDLKPRKP